jgi:nitrite reductase (NADH) large subunit
VLATGSRPRVPLIPGTGLEGVFTFRDLTDANRLKARTASSRSIVVLGGGVLGLETAKALRRFHTQVRVVEHNDHLMFSQLDAQAGGLLRRFVEEQGIEVLTREGVQQVLGVRRVDGVLLRSGRVIDCDTLVIAAGIIPNVDLAREAGIAVARGVRVDDRMATSAPGVYAVGECAEHRGVVYGLVAPGFEQAAVAAHNFAGDAAPASYLGSLTATRLKVVGLPIYSTGEVQEPDALREDAVFRDLEAGLYRRLFLTNGRLTGALAAGPWHETNRLQEAVTARRRVWPWELARFRARGILWSDLDDQSIFDWPSGAAVCNCTGVTRAELTAALRGGACTQAALSAQTGAGTVCGSCRPLLAELAGAAAPEPVVGWRSLAGLSVFALAAALLILVLPGIPYNASVQDPLQWDRLWREDLFKQVSGFTLLGLGVLVSLISVRKRLPRLPLGGFDLWRLLHVALGALAIAVLVAHTGLRTGHELNFWLMATFLGLLAAGGVGGAAVALEHRLPRPLARRARRISLWGHILLIWPLPALLGFHILKGYWY